MFSLTGQAGKLFKPLAFTKTFAMLGAVVVAISLVPVLVSIFLTDPTRRPNFLSRLFAITGWPLRKLADGITWLLKAIYGPIIRLAVFNIFTKLIIVGLAVAAFAVSIPLTPFYKNIGQEFMPPLNEGDLLFMPVLLPGASITQAKDVMTKQDLIINRFPEVSMVVGKLGRAMTATDPAPIGMFETIISVIDPKEWPRRTVKVDETAELAQTVANRLIDENVIGDAHAGHMNADFFANVATDAAGRIDEMATKYHNPYLPAVEREKLYRIWLLRVIIEELLTQMGESSKLGDSGSESELHRIASEIEPPLEHKRYFRTKRRPELITDLIEATRMPGVSPIMTQPIRNRIDMLATGIQTPIGVKVFGKDLATIEEIAVRIEQELLKLEGAVGPYAERIGNKPYIEFHIDREEAARYGIKIGAVQQIVMTAIGGMNLTYTIEGRKRFPIRVRYMRELRDNVEALTRVLVPTPKGVQIPLGQLVRVERHPGPAKIASENTLLFSRVFCDVDVDVIGLVDFVEIAQKTLDEKIKPTLPQGYFYSFSGQYEAELEARSRLILVVPICIAVIFMLLYIKFKSASAMFAIFLAIPFAFIGGMWMQWLMKYIPPALGGGYAIKYSTAVWVGYIALFGVAVEDGIVLIEYVLQRVRSGEPIDKAVVNAGLLRVRPIIMTTATTVLALLPIMLAEISTTTGAELMKPIAVPTFGGMVSATVANLILAPVLFSLFYGIESWIGRRKEAEGTTFPETETPTTLGTQDTISEEEVIVEYETTRDDETRPVDEAETIEESLRQEEEEVKEAISLNDTTPEEQVSNEAEETEQPDEDTLKEEKES